MSQKNTLIFSFITVLCFITLYVVNLNIQNSVQKEKISLDTLQVEASMYKMLKNFDNKRKTLEETVQNISKIKNPTKVNWQKDKAEIIYTSIQKHLIDRIIQTFIKKGHVIESFSLEKHNETMSLKMGVRP